MNGFLISCRPKDSKDLNLKLPFTDFKRVNFESLPNNRVIQLSTWGTKDGDVHIANSDDRYFLILSGYFTASKTLGTITDQAKALASIIKSIDHMNPSKSLHEVAKDSFGSFSLVYINADTLKIACLTDQLNSRPIWYSFKSKRNWTFSTHALPVKCTMDSTPYDLGALASLLIYGGPINPTKSVFKSIFSIPSGSILSTNEENALQTAKWYSFSHRPENRLSMSDWVQLGVERFRTAAQRHAASAFNSLIFLSGGVDSRLVACALQDTGIKPTLYTLCDSMNIETRIAKLVANSLNCKHFIFHRDQHYYLDQIQNNMLESGGNYVWTHSHFSTALRSILKQREIDCAMLGDYCETFSKLFCTPEIADFALSSPNSFLKFFDNIRAPLYQPPHKNLSLTLFNKNVRNGIIEHLNLDILDQYEKHLHISTDPLIIADQILRTGSASTLPTFQMFLDVRSVGCERNLFLDRDIYSLLEILPSKIRNQANFAAKIINAFSPKTALIPNSNTLLPIHWPPPLHKSTKFMKPYIGSIKRKLVSNTHKTSGSWPKKDMLYRYDPEWNKYISKLLCNGDLFDNHIFDFDVISKFWSEYNNGRLELSSDIERLISIAEISQIEKLN